MAKQIDSPNSLKNCPTMPFKNPMGPKTAITVRVVAITARRTSAVPSMAAWIADFPMVRWRKMFSLTTMASSTRRPTERLNAKSDMTLIENPAQLMRINAPISEFGSASPVISVERPLPRKKNTTMMKMTENKKKGK